jgi:hypothetical protein
MASQGVSLEFTVEDMASSAMESVIKTAEKLAAAAENAEKHVAGAVGAPGSPVAAAASTGVGRLAGGLQTLSNKFDGLSAGLSNLIGVGAGLGAALGFHKMFEVVNEKIGDTIRLKKLTGLATEEASALNETFEAVGVGADVSGSILQRMVLSAERMKMFPSGARQSYAMLGVDIRRGPVQSMLAMSKRVQDGKLETAGLARGMRLSYDEADKLMKVLKTGPDAIRESMKDTGGVVDSDIAAFKAMKQAQIDVGRAWEDISFLVGREMLPVVAKLLQHVADGAKKWVEPAKRFGEFLNMHLTQAVGLATTLGKILLANAALQKASGMGIGGVAQAGYGYAKGVATNVVGAAAMATGASGGGAVSLALNLLRGFAGVLGPIALLLPIVIAGVQGLWNNVGGGLDELIDSVSDIIDSVETMFSPLTDMLGGGSAISSFMQLVLPAALLAITQIIKGVVDMITIIGRWIGGIIKSVGNGFQYENEAAAQATSFMAIADQVRVENENRKKERTTHTRVAGDNAKAKKGDFNQNFYGSRFDITQKFEEGFDPDRVLTAFTNDLAALGERGTMSGFQPAFAGATSKG